MSIVQDGHLIDIWGKAFYDLCRNDAQQYFGTTDVGAIMVMAVQRLRESGGQTLMEIERMQGKRTATGRAPNRAERRKLGVPKPEKLPAEEPPAVD